MITKHLQANARSTYFALIFSHPFSNLEPSDESHDLMALSQMAALITFSRPFSRQSISRWIQDFGDGNTNPKGVCLLFRQITHENCEIKENWSRRGERPLGPLISATESSPSKSAITIKIFCDVLHFSSHLIRYAWIHFLFYRAKAIALKNEDLRIF